MHAFFPVGCGLSHHPRNEVNIDLGEANRLGELVGSVNLLGPMSPPIELQDVVVKVLNTQTKTRDADFLDNLELAFG